MKFYSVEYYSQEEDEITSTEIFEVEKHLIQQLFVKDPNYFDELKQIVFS